MDLWVRDSTKTKLIKVDNVYLKKLDTSIFEPKLLKYQGIDYIYCIFTNNECLSEYNSEERAMEVLDGIQQLLIYGYIDTETMKKLGTIPLTNSDCVVFDMPEK